MARAGNCCSRAAPASTMSRGGPEASCTIGMTGVLATRLASLSSVAPSSGAQARAPSGAQRPPTRLSISATLA
jgi:hypothetical protein